MYKIYTVENGFEKETRLGSEDMLTAIEHAVNMAGFEVRHSKVKLSFDTANNQDGVLFQVRIFRTKDNQIINRIQVRKA